MAKKGTYHVHDPEGQPAAQDTSYKSFLCVLLVFIAFCVLVIVFSSVNWYKAKEREPLEKTGDKNANVEHFDKDRYVQEDTTTKTKTAETPKTTPTEKQTQPNVTQTPLQSTSTSAKPIVEEDKNKIEQLPTNAVDKEVTTPQIVETTTIRKALETEKSTTVVLQLLNITTTISPTIYADQDQGKAPDKKENVEIEENATSTPKIQLATTIKSSKEGDREGIKTTPQEITTTIPEVIAKGNNDKENERKENEDKREVETETTVPPKVENSTTMKFPSTITNGNGNNDTQMEVTMSPKMQSSTTIKSPDKNSAEEDKIKQRENSKNDTDVEIIAMTKIETTTQKQVENATDFNGIIETTNSSIHNTTIDSDENKYDNSESTESQIGRINAQTELSVIDAETTENNTTNSSVVGHVVITKSSTMTLSFTPQTTSIKKVVTTFVNEVITEENKLATAVDQEMLSKTTTEQGSLNTTTVIEKKALEVTTTEAIDTLKPSQENVDVTTPKKADEFSGEVDGEASPEENDDVGQLKNTATTSRTPYANASTTSTSTSTTTATSSTTSTSTETAKSSTTSTSTSTATSSTSSTSTKTANSSTTSTSTTTSTSPTTSTTSTTTMLAPIKRKLNPLQTVAATRLRNKFKMTVSNMLGLMDHTTDMCEDFYWYSCGAATEKSLPEQKKDAGFRERLRREVKNPTKLVFTEKMNLFYKTCIDHESFFDYEARVKQVNDTVKKFIEDNASKENFTRLFAEMALMNSLPIMEVGVDVDIETKEYVFKLSPPYRTLTRDSMEHWSALYATDSNCAKQLLRQDFDSPHLNLNQIYNDYTNCSMDFNHYLASINITRRALNLLSKVENLEFFVENEVLDYIKGVKTTVVRDSLITRTYEVQTVVDLQKKFINIDWKLFFRMVSGQNVIDSSKVFVYNMDTLYEIFKHLSTYEIKESYKNFLAIYANDIYYNIVIPKPVDTKEYCSKLVDYLFSDVSSYLYMRNLDQEQIGKAAEVANKIFQVLHTHLESSVNGSTSIEDDDKRGILNRIDILAPYFMKKSDECISELALKRKYQSIDMGANYTYQLIEMRKFKNGQKFTLIGQEFKDADIFCYFVQPQDLKPKSFYASSKIAMPYEFLLPWSMDYPSNFLMAKVGMNIAIEMGKLFNSVGLSYIVSDTNTITEALRTEMMEEFYVVQERNLSMTVSEAKNIQSIGDNAAFRLIRTIYNENQSDYNSLPWIRPTFLDKQIFFIASAQEFCEDANPLDYMLRLYEGESLPNYWRVNNMIINSKEFKRVFGCKSGCNMSPSGASYLAFPEVAEEEEDEEL